MIALGLGATTASGEEPPRAETATFSMYCYWTGEATVGRVPGVLRSRIGHLGGSEIVQVDFDPARTSAEALAAALRSQGSFYARIDPDPAVRVPRFVESKHSLRTAHPDLYYLDLAEEQAIALNSWSYFGGPMPDVLAAEQKQRWGKLKGKLRSRGAGGLDPSESRSGEALDRYRRRLEAWLAE